MSKNLHEPAAGWLAGVKDERETIGGDIFVRVREPLLDDVAKDGVHVLTWRL